MAGRIVRQGRWLALLILAAAAFTPGAIRAQDVIVLPPATATDTSTPTPIPVVVTPDAAATDAASSALPTSQTSVPTMLPQAAPAAVATVMLDPKFRQCAADADCVLVTDGCGALEAVSQAYVANWQAATPHAADCQKTFDVATAQLAMTAVCRSATCGKQLKNLH